jgi:uncharacterized cupredoxin-like copper-binding protein
MKVNGNHSIKIARISVLIALTSLAMLILAACGGGNTAESTTQPVVASPTAVALATATEDMMGMPEMPTAPAMPTAVATGTLPVPVSTTGTGPSEGATPTQATVGQGAATQIQAKLIEWSITLSQQEAPAGKIVFTVTNEGRGMHNFSINSASGEVAATRTFQPSESPQTLEVELQPGTYEIICSLPGHAQRGQRTTLVVK